MTQITTGPDGQPRFDGMTAGEIAASLDLTSGVSDQGDRLLAAAAAALRHLSEWQPIETAPKDRLIDILINGETRWCDCHYDQICDQWRTTGPSNHLVWITARAVTHWRLAPPPPPPKGTEP
jgi:hypothetical protein